MPEEGGGRGGARGMERAMGVEPTLSAWKAEVLPLNYARVGHWPPQASPAPSKGPEQAGRARAAACSMRSRRGTAGRKRTGAPARVEGRGGWWGEADSNRRRREPPDLQSGPFGRSGISPCECPHGPASTRRGATARPPHARGGRAASTQPRAAAEEAAKAQVFPVPGSSADASLPWAPRSPRRSFAGLRSPGRARTARRPRGASAPVSSVRLSRFHGTARRRSVGGPSARALRVPGGSSRVFVVLSASPPRGLLGLGEVEPTMGVEPTTP